MTTSKIAALCGIAAVTAITWLMWTRPGSATELGPGQRLFDHETFGGNGRTCRTCHSGDDGTIDAPEVSERLAQNPSDPLFSHDGLDDFISGTSRITASSIRCVVTSFTPMSNVRFSSST